MEVPRPESVRQPVPTERWRRFIDKLAGEAAVAWLYANRARHATVLDLQ